MAVKERERIIGAIAQGFTCLAAQSTQNLALEDYPTLTRLNNRNRKQEINKIVHETSPTC
jgi:hypothetical protein